MKAVLQDCVLELRPRYLLFLLSDEHLVEENYPTNYSSIYYNLQHL